MNDPSSTPKGVVFDACQPRFKSMFIYVVVAVTELELFNDMVGVKVVILRVVSVEDIRFASWSHGCNNVGGADVDDMRIALDMMVQMIEANRNGCLVFGKQ